MNIVEFLTARLAEDERVARAVDDNSEPWPGRWKSDGNMALRTYNGWVLAHNRGEPFTPGLVDHLARHDPARVLREVEARRWTLDLHAPEDGYCTYCLESESDLYGRTYAQSPCMDLRLLALPFAGHADYQESWKPMSDQALGREIRRRLRQAVGTAAIEQAKASVPPVRKVAVYLPRAVEPKPTSEDRERWRQEMAALAKLLADHPQRMADAGSPLREILELHAPVSESYGYVCHGCDIDGSGAEHPEWPCRTYCVAIGEQP